MRRVRAHHHPCGVLCATPCAHSNNNRLIIINNRLLIGFMCRLMLIIYYFNKINVIASPKYKRSDISLRNQHDFPTNL